MSEHGSDKHSDNIGDAAAASSSAAGGAAGTSGSSGSSDDNTSASCSSTAAGTRSRPGSVRWHYSSQPDVKSRRLRSSSGGGSGDGSPRPSSPDSPKQPDFDADIADDRSNLPHYVVGVCCIAFACAFAIGGTTGLVVGAVSSVSAGVATYTARNGSPVGDLCTTHVRKVKDAARETKTWFTSQWDKMRAYIAMQSYKRLLFMGSFTFVLLCGIVAWMMYHSAKVKRKQRTSRTTFLRRHHLNTKETMTFSEAKDTLGYVAALFCMLGMPRTGLVKASIGFKSYLSMLNFVYTAVLGTASVVTVYREYTKGEDMIGKTLRATAEDVARMEIPSVSAADIKWFPALKKFSEKYKWALVFLFLSAVGVFIMCRTRQNRARVNEALTTGSASLCLIHGDVCFVIPETDGSHDWRVVLCENVDEIPVVFNAIGTKEDLDRIAQLAPKLFKQAKRVVPFALRTKGMSQERDIFVARKGKRWVAYDLEDLPHERTELDITMGELSQCDLYFGSRRSLQMWQKQYGSDADWSINDITKWNQDDDHSVNDDLSDTGAQDAPTRLNRGDFEKLRVSDLEKAEPTKKPISAPVHQAVTLANVMAAIEEMKKCSTTCSAAACDAVHPFKTGQPKLAKCTTTGCKGSCGKFHPKPISEQTCNGKKTCPVGGCGRKLCKASQAPAGSSQEKGDKYPALSAADKEKIFSIDIAGDGETNLGGCFNYMGWVVTAGHMRPPFKEKFEAVAYNRTGKINFTINAASIGVITGYDVCIFKAPELAKFGSLGAHTFANYAGEAALIYNPRLDAVSAGKIVSCTTNTVIATTSTDNGWSGLPTMLGNKVLGVHVTGSQVGDRSNSGTVPIWVVTAYLKALSAASDLTPKAQ